LHEDLDIAIAIRGNYALYLLECSLLAMSFDKDELLILAKPRNSSRTYLKIADCCRSDINVE